MLPSTFFTLATSTLLTLTSALPSPHIHHTGVIHRITAGSTTSNAGLSFEPENVVADIGDIIEFHFLPKNHSVVQSSFARPCEPLIAPNSTHLSGVFSGFNFATKAGEAENVFSFIVKDTKPFWYYCSQTVGNHCQKGMSGVVNQGFEGVKTLGAYKEAARNTTTVQASTNVKESHGGWVAKNVGL
jgi:plastocyanin